MRPSTTETKEEEYVIRRIEKGDMTTIMRLEREIFEFPWDRKDFIRFLGPTPHSVGVIIAPKGGPIAGYMVYELGKGEIDILNLAIDAPHRRKKIGMRLINALKGNLGKEGRQCIVSKVRETNVSAQMFFRSLGFKIREIMTNYYEGSKDDAYGMKYERRRKDAEKFKRFVAEAMPG